MAIIEAAAGLYIAQLLWPGIAAMITLPFAIWWNYRDRRAWNAICDRQEAHDAIIKRRKREVEAEQAARLVAEEAKRKAEQSRADTAACVNELAEQKRRDEARDLHLAKEWLAMPDYQKVPPCEESAKSESWQRALAKHPLYLAALERARVRGQLP